MSAVTSAQVNELRQKTGAGMMDCKKALTETSGDLEKAVDWLRKKGLSNAAKKAGRLASEGLVGSYLHMGGKVGVLVEVNTETDFVAGNESFKEFVKDICLHVCAGKPLYLESAEVPADILARERDIARDMAKQSGKPEQFHEKIVEGKIAKYFDETCLVEQAWVKDPSKKVKDVLQDLVAKLGENIKIRRFVRFEMGEGLQKKNEDFAAEVAAKIGISN